MRQAQLERLIASAQLMRLSTPTLQVSSCCGTMPPPPCSVTALRWPSVSLSIRSFPSTCGAQGRVMVSRPDYPPSGSLCMISSPLTTRLAPGILRQRRIILNISPVSPTMPSNLTTPL